MSIRVLMQTEKLKGGPAMFRSRLITTLNGEDDIEIVTDPKSKFDIEIAFIQKNLNHKKPYILRLGNCYYMKRYKLWNNKPIKKSILKAGHVIFQSKFAYKLFDKVFMMKKRNTIKCDYSFIRNGVDLDYLHSIEPDKDVIPGSFMACARWDPNKRPVSMIKGFLKADTGKHLYIIGDVGIEGRGKNLGKKYSKNPYIHFLGHKTNPEVISVMKACDYQIHLAFIDICPNTVLEGLSVGLNVLCTNLGGTHELVGKNGIVLKTDKFWPKHDRYLKKRMEDLDKLDSRVIADGIHALLNKKRVNSRPDFDIKNIGEKYANIIKGIIN